MDAYCVYTADQYLMWAKEDDMLIGMFPSTAVLATQCHAA